MGICAVIESVSHQEVSLAHEEKARAQDPLIKVRHVTHRDRSHWVTSRRVADIKHVSLCKGTVLQSAQCVRTYKLIPAGILLNVPTNESDSR